MIKKIIFTIISAFLIKNIYEFAVFADLFKKVEFNDEKCQKVALNIKGGEDLVLFDNRYIITGGDLRLDLWNNKEKGPLFTESGNLYYIDTQQSDSIGQEMNLINFPSKELAFHPHGLYLYKSANLLYVVNHAYQRGGERIEVFNISKDQKENLQATWLYSIYDQNNFDNHIGTFNDLIIINENEFYITKFQLYGDSKEGANSNDIIREIREFITKKIMIQLFIRGTDVFYVQHKQGKVLTFQKANEQSFYAANGIASNKNNSQIFVVDTVSKSISVFDRQQDNMLKKKTEIKLPVMLDNIELDDETGYLQAGSVVSMINAADVLNYKSQDQMNQTLRDCPRCGGTYLINSEYPYDFKETIVTSQMYGISSSIRVKDYQYMGSFVDNGLVKCKI